MNKESLKEYLAADIKAGVRSSTMLFFPFSVKMTLRMVLKQSFWRVSPNEDNWQKRREYAASSKLE